VDAAIPLPFTWRLPLNRSLFRARAPLALLVALALPACAMDDEANPGLSSGENPDATVFLTQKTPPGAVMEALYEGKVNRDAKGCLRVESEGAVVIWPYGFRLAARDGKLFVENAEGRSIGQIGGDFRMGGGFVPAGNTDTYLSAADQARVAACPTSHYWIVGDTG
jgi:hypothetical protein